MQGVVAPTIVALTIAFQSDGNAASFMRGGWSTPEPHGTWSIGSESRLVIPLDGLPPIHSFHVAAAPWVTDAPLFDSQRLTVIINGHEAKSLNAAEAVDVAIDLAQFGDITQLDIVFQHPDAVQPRSVLGTGDSRILAFRFTRIELLTRGQHTAPAPAALAQPAPAPQPNPIVTSAATKEALHTNRLTRTWAELDAVLPETMEKSGANYSFMRKAVALLGLPERSVANFARDASIACGAALLTATRNPLSPIPMPCVTHRIWLTSDTTPSMPPDDYIGPLLASNRALPSDALHIFWSNSAAVREHVQRSAIADGCFNLIAGDPDMFAAEPCFTTLCKLIEDRKFVLAADVLRFLAVHRFGGIYADLGGLFDSACLDYVQACDYGFSASPADFFQSSTFAAVPGSDVTGIFLAILANPYALSPSYALLGNGIGPMDELHVISAPALTLIILLFTPAWARIAMLPMQSPHMTFRAQQSWYGTQPKHGNVLVDKSAPSFLSLEKFQANAAPTPPGLTFFGHDPILREKLRILLLTADHFEFRPTRLCRLLATHGSHRALGWHNYGYIYNYLFGTERGRARRIVDVGTALPALHAWCEFFPLATIIGCVAPDSPAGTDENRIKTIPMDWTVPQQLDALFTPIEHRSLDFVMADGQKFEAGMHVYAAAHRCIRPGGYLAIENVGNADLDKWSGMLAATGHVGALLQLPHPNNHNDNNLVLIPGRGA